MTGLKNLCCLNNDCKVVHISLAHIFSKDMLFCRRVRVGSSASGQHVMRYRRFGINLIDSFSRVQQLLVRMIFLLGISDSSKPICHLTFR
jgi:hypothetical protein